MNSIALSFTGLASFLLLVLPRRWAPLPFLMAACYITQGQVVMIGPFHFTVIRILVAIGIVRIVLRGERPVGGLNGLDWLMILWAVWALSSALFHRDPQATLINRLGHSWDALGIYFLMRCAWRNLDEVKGAIVVIAILLAPVALEMINEQIAHRNIFSVFGGVSEVPAMREGHFRAQGPFRHSILAGTVGAISVPLMIGIWRTNPHAAKLGLAACLVMVVTSVSSGPLMSLFAAILGIVLWKWRQYTKEMRIGAVVGYFLLDLIMKAPAYYIIARIDLVGGSTGWHRARLIESAIEHISEWWLVGTDYTRHWMPTGVSWSPEHTDITNHYLRMGVLGGVPLMLLFISCVWWGFRYVGEILKNNETVSNHNLFLVWALGASLFAHAVTCISVSFFDQSSMFLYLNLAMISSLRNEVSDPSKK